MRLIVLLTASLLTEIFARPVNSQGVLAVLSENGRASLATSETIVIPLFCEGQGESCGEVKFFNLDFIRFDTEEIDLFADVTVCAFDASSSCLTTRSALFIQNAVPEIPDPEGITFAATMTAHDPIACEDATGIFAEAGCAGKLTLDYRCQAVFDVVGGEFVRSLGGSYIVSTMD
jgi:hypothetical protein